MELTVPQALLLFFLVFLLLSAVLIPSPFAFLVPPYPSLAQEFFSKPVDAPCLEPLKVYVVDLAREFSYGLLEEYYRSRQARGNHSLWLLADLLTEQPLRASYSAAVRVREEADADVFLVPFLCALSAEIQLGEGHGRFRKKMAENREYVRQRKVMDFVMQTSALIALMFVTMFSCSQVVMCIGSKSIQLYLLGTMTLACWADPMAMWHVRGEIARSILFVVDFGGWYMEDAKAGENAKASCGEAMDVAHTNVSLTKYVIVPYTHLLLTLNLAYSSPRDVLLYFRGARHRHRTGLMREKLWTVLENEPGVILEKGFPQHWLRGGPARSQFCLNPAGDTPTSSRLFDSIAKLCIPVIVRDTVEPPFEGILDYSTFAVFVSVNDEMSPGILVQHLRNNDTTITSTLRERLREVQQHFEYENEFRGGRGSVVKEGAVQLIWRKVKEKVPGLKATITREQRKL